MNTAKLFLAFAVESPWPEILPSARLLASEERHLTMVFLGTGNRDETINTFKSISKPPHSLGLAGYFDIPLFLPEHSPNVVSWHVEITHDEEIREYVSSIHAHMNVAIPKRWLPHVTIGRRPFDKKEWRKSFYPLPMMTSKICLYESIGNLRYKAIAEHELIPVIEKLEHTADVAFLLRGHSFDDLFHNALIALAFEEPKFCRFRHTQHEIASIDDIVVTLGHFITELDTEEGSPFKGVSFHGIAKEKHGILEWEMIVDV